MIVTIAIGILVLSLLILAHELGHFFTAKKSGVKVEEFGLGFPPRLFGIRRGETLFSLNAIPFGGFNRLSGEEDPTAPKSLAGKNRGIRLLVLSAGSLVNILLSLILLSIAFMIPHDMVIGQVVVEEVAPNSPAALAGIEPGDIFLEVNGKPVRSTGDLHRYIQSNLGKELTILIAHRDTAAEEIQAVPRWTPPEGQGAIGVRISMQNPSIISERIPFLQAIPMGSTVFAETIVLYANGIVSMLSGSVSGEIVGPIGIIRITGEVAKTGISPLLEFAAIISLILGIVNLFPIPAVDGGRITFVLLEWVRRGRRVSPKTEGRVHIVGFAVLMILLLTVTYRDIIRIIGGGNPLP